MVSCFCRDDVWISQIQSPPPSMGEDEGEGGQTGLAPLSPVPSRGKEILKFTHCQVFWVRSSL